MQSGVIGRKNVVSKFVEKFQKTERTADRYYKLAKAEFERINLELDKKKEFEFSLSELQMQKKGLQSKFERSVFLQDQSKRIITILESGNIKDIYFDQNGNSNEITRPIKPHEIASLSRALKELLRELALRHGDHKPNMLQHTFLNDATQIEIGYDDAGEELIEDIAQEE